MPNIKDESTVEAIARAFTGEAKRVKEQALRIVGYKPSYYLSGRATQVVYGNARVKDAIRRLDDIALKKVEVSEAEIVQRLRMLSGLDPVPDDDNGPKPNRTEQIRATELLGKTKAMFTDNISSTNKTLSINVAVKE